MTAHVETIVIGAGPGGLRCAEVLAAAGREVVVFERKERIGPKTCAGGIPFHAGQELRLPGELIEASFADQHIVTPRRRVVLRTGVPAISTVNRAALGEWMAARARAAGAEIHAACRVRRVEHGRVETDRGAFTCRHLVGADGSASMVRRLLGLPVAAAGAGLQVTLPRPLARMEWHLDPSRFHSGYAWIFPHRQTTSVGIYADRNDLAPGRLPALLRQWAAEQGIDIAGLAPEASLISFDFRGWRFGNTYLVGDAAGLASAFTGEGIYPAMVSGAAVAKSIIDPGHRPAGLARLLRRHRRHRRLQRFFTRGGIVCQIALDMIVLALQWKLLDFSLLEMK